MPVPASPTSLGIMAIGTLPDIAGSDPFGFGFNFYLQPGPSVLATHVYASDASASSAIIHCRFLVPSDSDFMRKRSGSGTQPFTVRSRLAGRRHTDSK